MREITKTLTIPVDGKKTDFRLTKLDAFSGASLLRMLSHLPAGDDFLSFFSVLPDVYRQHNRNNNRAASFPLPEFKKRSLPSENVRLPPCSFQKRRWSEMEENTTFPDVYCLLVSSPMADNVTFLYPLDLSSGCGSRPTIVISPFPGP